MNQSLANNFAINCNRPKVTTIEQEPPQETSRQSPCPSIWSDYLHVEDYTDDENVDPAETMTEPSQPSTSTGTHVPQDLHADTNAISIPKSLPKALTTQKGKGKHRMTETMRIVVVLCNLNFV